MSKRYLMAPGPTPVPPEVLAAGAEAIIHHRGPDFRALMLRCLGRLGEVCRTRNDVLLFTASGSGGFESAVVNLLSPGDRVLAVAAGEFGQRWAKLARAFGLDVDELQYAWGETPRPEDARGGRRARASTSTGRGYGRRSRPAPRPSPPPCPSSRHSTPRSGCSSTRASRRRSRATRRWVAHAARERRRWGSSSSPRTRT